MLATVPPMFDKATYGSLAERPYASQATDTIDMMAKGRGFRSPISSDCIADRTAAAGAKYKAVEVKIPILGANVSAIWTVSGDKAKFPPPPRGRLKKDV